DRCCVYKKEIQPRRTKYRGIWAILMHKMMFPSKLQFCFKRYILRIPSVFCYRGNVLPAYPLNHFAYPWGYAYPSLGTDALEDGQIVAMKGGHQQTILKYRLWLSSDYRLELTGLKCAKKTFPTPLHHRHQPGDWQVG